jgi:hypothetical protein
MRFIQQSIEPGPDEMRCPFEDPTFVTAMGYVQDARTCLADA